MTLASSCCSGPRFSASCSCRLISVLNSGDEHANKEEQSEHESSNEKQHKQVSKKEKINEGSDHNHSDTMEELGCDGIHN